MPFQEGKKGIISTQMKRLFVAVHVPKEINHHMTSHLEKHPGISGLRWVPEEFRHITLKFLGQVESSKIVDIQSVLKYVVSRFGPFSLHLEAGGVFPSKSNPRVFWTAVKGDNGQLKTLAETLETELTPIGFPPENRKFKPHVSLARGNGNGDGQAADLFCSMFETYLSPVFMVDNVCLVESILGPVGPRYESLLCLPLQAA